LRRSFGLFKFTFHGKRGKLEGIDPAEKTARGKFPGKLHAPYGGKKRLP
jgi:hypothetical protein